MKASIPLLATSLAALGYASMMDAHAPVPVRSVSFDRDISPILSGHCFKCHGPDVSKAAAGLRLDSFAGATKTLDDGRAIVPGHPEESILLQRVSAKNPGMRMPPATAGVTALTVDQIATVRAWIGQGAKYEKHWSFVPPRMPALPVVSQPRWCKNPIDRFVLAKLDSAGLKPEPEADQNTIALRAAETLTGLPPTAAELDAFRQDGKPGAYERYVDRLIASPAYGEQQARYWLDAVRYGDTHGLQLDNERSVYPYRDWVVAAFNKDLPYDKFVLWQIAGDLLPKPTTEQLVATGYVRMNLTSNEGGAIAEEFLARNTFDRVDTTGTVLLGMTIGCAKCHDHKFDPIKQRDYYGLYAFFDSTKDEPLDGNIALPPPFIDVPSQEQARDRVRLTGELEGIRARVNRKDALAWLDTQPKKAPLSNDAEIVRKYLIEGPATEDAVSYRKVVKQKADLEASIPKTLIAREMAKPRPTFILKRGQYDQKADPVVRHIPPALGVLPPGAPHDRLGLAEWMTSPNNPLVARVFVNRVWQQYFGAGIVKTSEDFGSQGEWPVNQQLLDYLAVSFIRDGWSVKRLNRTIVTSAAFRQSSRITPLKLAKDAENRLISRGPRFRLDAEEIRDKALDAGGLLVTTLGGHGFKPYQPSGLWEGASDPASGTHIYKRDHDKSIYRRSMYMFWKRTSPPPVLVTYDAPLRDTCTVRRAITNTPLQALTSLNETAFLEADRTMAQRLLELKESDRARLRTAFELALCRPPEAREVKILMRALARYRKKYDANPSAAKKLITVGDAPESTAIPAPEQAAWMIVCSTLTNMDEFLTLH